MERSLLVKPEMRLEAKLGSGENATMVESRMANLKAGAVVACGFDPIAMASCRRYDKASDPPWLKPMMPSKGPSFRMKNSRYSSELWVS